MPFTCELSGQIVSGLKDEVVATPSGHICLKRLLLEKLSENGGIDPFGSEPENDRPLSSDELISLKLSEKDQVLTPRPSATSIPSMLQLFQSEYDALVLELFDTRKALEDARQELSQALYQNDAAVRVIARLSTERDSARQELQQWQASTQATPGDSSGGVATNGSSHEEPDAKRRKVDEPENAGIQRNRLPEHDLNLMLATWKSLSSNRKTVLKAAAASAPTPEIVAQYAKIGSQAWHKTTCKGVNCMAASGDLLVTGGKDKQVILYSVKEKVMKYSWQFGSVPEYVGISDSIIVACSKAGKVAVYSVGDGSAIDSLKISDAHIAGVKVHPTGEHVCFTSTEGKILVARFQDNKLTTIAGYTGESEEARYTCGDVHPDGLLFAAGTTSGHVHLWDFKNNALASILKPDDDESDPITGIAFSSNGYHLATGHKSATTRFWDLRKQKVVARMNDDKSLKSISTIAFDPSGKFAAVGGVGGVLLTVVKEWGKTAAITTKKEVTNLEWMATGLVSISSKERQVSFYGVN